MKKTIKSNMLAVLIFRKLSIDNQGLAERERRRKPTDEIKFIAMELKMNYYTVFYWYINRFQPKNPRKQLDLEKLYAKYLRKKERFYKKINEIRL